MPGLAQRADDRQQLAVLARLIHARRLGQGGFRADVNDVRPLLAHDPAAAHGALGGEADALPIPGVRREIDHAHDRGLRVEGEVPAADGEFLDARLGRSAVLFEQFGQLFQSQHGGQGIADYGRGKPEFNSSRPVGTEYAWGEGQGPFQGYPDGGRGNKQSKRYLGTIMDLSGSYYGSIMDLLWDHVSWIYHGTIGEL